MDQCFDATKYLISDALDLFSYAVLGFQILSDLAYDVWQEYAQRQPTTHISSKLVYMKCC